MFFFLFFLVLSSNFLANPVAREKIKVKLALTIPIGAPIALANEIIDTPPLVALKILNYIIKTFNLFNF